MCEDPQPPGKLQKDVRGRCKDHLPITLSFPGSWSSALSSAGASHQMRFLWATASQGDARLPLFVKLTLAEHLLGAGPMPGSSQVEQHSRCVFTPGLHGEEKMPAASGALVVDTPDASSPSPQ